MKNGTAQAEEAVKRLATPGQLKDLCAMAVQAIPSDLVFVQAEDVLSRKAEFVAHVRKFFPAIAGFTDPVKIWENFYVKYLGIVVDLTGVQIPERTDAQKKEFTRLIIVAKGLTNNVVYDACERAFKCYKYADDLDQAVPTNERDPKTGSYAIWVRDTVEADEVHQNKSANMVKEEGLKTETLLERMIHELVYFSETRKHLDVTNVTLCSGSRGSDGYVPCAYWYDGKFWVGWYYMAARSDCIRSREAVTL